MNYPVGLSAIEKKNNILRFPCTSEHNESDSGHADHPAESLSPAAARGRVGQGQAAPTTLGGQVTALQIHCHEVTVLFTTLAESQILLQLKKKWKHGEGRTVAGREGGREDGG